MPIPDLGQRRTALETSFVHRLSKRRKPPNADGGTASPVTPDRPLELSGGAAAALEFDE